MDFEIEIEDFDFKKNDEGHIEAWAPWEEEKKDGLMFLIKDVPQEQRQVLLNQSKTHKSMSLRKKNESDEFFGTIDFAKFNKGLILLSIIDWKGLKNRHLLEILNTKKRWTFKGEPDGDGKYDPEFEIVFDIEIKREIAALHSAEFINFVNNAHEVIEKLSQVEKGKELKN